MKQMVMRTVVFALAIAYSGVAALPKPQRVPSAVTPEQMAVIREGVALHDQHNYEAAIIKYKQVLAANPWEVHALQELALTYLASKRYEDAISTAKLGIQCKSDSLPQFYMLIANALDEQGKRKEAIETYRAGVKLNPDIALLHYNLAISLRRAGEPAQAKSEAERAVRCDPRHASSHAVLAAIYNEMGYRIPAILAYSRFLELEPDSPRSKQMVPALLYLLTSGVTQGQDKTQINITLVAPAKQLQDEGDFEPAEMMMSLIVAANAMEEKKKTVSAYERLVSIYAGLGGALENSKPKNGFAAKYYAPYFAGLVREGHTEAFVAQSWKAAQIEGTANWETANEAKMEQFRNWSSSFRWPSK